jgi:hypothetical protein
MIEEELDAKGKMVVSEANRRLDLAATQVKELTEQLNLLQQQLSSVQKERDTERETVAKLSQTVIRKEKGLEEALDALGIYHEQAHPWLKPKAPTTPPPSGANGSTDSMRARTSALSTITTNQPISATFSIPSASLSATNAAASQSFTAGSPHSQPATPKRAGIPAKSAAKTPGVAAKRPAVSQSMRDLSSPTAAGNALRSPRVGTVAVSPRASTTSTSSTGTVVAAKKRPVSATGVSAKKSPAKTATTTTQPATVRA